MFLIPGIGNAMRVNGRAYVEDDPVLLASFTVESMAPCIVMVISAQEVYFHCARALIRSRLWQKDSHLNPRSMPTPGQILG
jgi:predicted pyridoxine 5'-phosphate oxidase superfamily flavin-nucleotide-binding protein